MPLESLTTLLLAATGAAALSIIAGAEATGDALTAVQTAQTVKSMSEEALLWYALAGGFIGGIASWALGYQPQNIREGSKQVLGSALSALIFGPLIVLYFDMPQKLPVVICINGILGLIASAVLLKVMPLLPALLPAWLRTKGIRAEDYDMTGNRPHGDNPPPPKTPNLQSPPPRRPRKPFLDDDGTNSP